MRLATTSADLEASLLVRSKLGVLERKYEVGKLHAYMTRIQTERLIGNERLSTSWLATNQASRAGICGGLGDLDGGLLASGSHERAMDWHLSHQPHTGLKLLTC